MDVKVVLGREQFVTRCTVEGGPILAPDFLLMGATSYVLGPST